VALIPHACAVLFGKYVLKMNPVLLLGACAERHRHRGPARAGRGGQQAAVLGYTVPYAIGNILLTAWGRSSST